MKPIAEQLNNVLKSENQHVLDMLSQLGKELFYPKGILSQSAEAKQSAHKFNATIGMATENGEMMHLDLIQKTLSDYEPKDLYPYAPPAGKPELRSEWRKKIIRDNPSLRDKTFGTPIVTNALTHGMSIAADLFVDHQDPVIVPDKYWGNYNFIFELRRGGRLNTFPLFNDQETFNVEGLREAVFAQKDHGKAVVVLNFPNNPTGYTPHEEEAEKIVSVLLEAAEAGMNIVAVTDDAYFKLFFEDSIKESLFSRLANLHPRILAVKVDGATKEEFVWGFRVGFITFASTSSKVVDALEQKATGLIRGTISSASHPSQTFVLKALQSPEFAEQQDEKCNIMKKRANKVKDVLNNNEKYRQLWSYYPFNSGYFMCLKLKEVNAEEARKHLLDKYGVGVVAINATDLRVAFSCVEEEDIEELFELIYQGVKDLSAVRS
ncbi:aspartate/methionine/tyrosine aminotransferase [Scopulibacillus daqui]|uniref:Aspartate/methionine/tyrosine aminotransferase n=1 Tax=Scopulibacillus daqui TaxID=1469162 RepID=A0ABS2PY19_9BACL|nr:aminotransferase class I/II-fold pyridoxal phosphate-dependent enzyme [Scopulibacillus daqui]MBM7644937.1 aspartate/methionine/tyrosine aminotransferase [Scopulibacillus daqui]